MPDEIDEGATPEDEADYPDSGPYCRHWSDLGCEEPCATCPHSCGRHQLYADERCNECDCQKFKD